MKTLHIKPSEYHEMEFDHRALPDLSKTGPVSASILCKSKHAVPFLSGVKIKPTGAMDWGNLVDTKLLTPEFFNELYITKPDDMPKDLRHFRDAKTKSASTEESIRRWDEFEEIAGGRLPIDQKEMEQVEIAVHMARSHPITGPVLARSDKQLCFIGEHHEFPGATLKGLVDILPNAADPDFGDAIVDWKTTNDISDDGLKKTIWRFEYHLKMAFYGQLAEKAGHGPRPRGVLFFQSSKYPYEVRCVEISPDDMALGLDLARCRFDRLKTMSPEKIGDFIDKELRMIHLADWQRREGYNQFAADDTEEAKETQEAEA